MARKIRYGGTSMLDAMEKSITPDSSKPVAPVAPVTTPTTPLPSTLQPGVLYPLDAIPIKKMTDKSTEGSPPFSKAELKQGYRKVGK